MFEMLFEFIGCGLQILAGEIFKDGDGGVVLTIKNIVF